MLPSNGFSVVPVFSRQLMRELSAACKTTASCIKKSPFEKITCIRKCVSNNCYASGNKNGPNFVTFKDWI